MDDYIKRQVTTNAIANTIIQGESLGMSIAEDIMYDVPSEDVQPVVRCKDCRLSEPGIGITEYWCCYWDNKTLENGYCSYGERRGSEQNDVSDTNVGNIITADGMIRGVKDFFKDYNGCRNCKHQPQPMQMCDYGKRRNRVELICSGWERKGGE